MIEIKILEGEMRKKRFDGAFCSFLPAGWVNIGGVEYPLGYKVVTTEMKSLGLRRNPNIMTFHLGSWDTLPDSEVVPGIGDWGGIWIKRTLGGANSLRRYMWDEKGHQEVRMFLSAMDTPLFANDSRIKAKGVFLLSEI
jgi:hypothetical protein